MNFTKMQGAGNDFVLIEAGDTQHNWSAVAMTICDRHFGIGADGLLLLLPSEVADYKMRIFNPDGSEAEACGNGLRCFTKYIADMGMVDSAAREIRVETIAGVRRAEIQKVAGKVTTVKTGMGEPRFRAEDIPAVIEPRQGSIVDIKSMLCYSITVDGQELALNLVSTGNPHAVCFMNDKVSDFPLARLGPMVERNQIFPSGINFEVARIIGRRQIEARAWEKGVGETLACGSGACAITVAAQLHGYVDNIVDVRLPGGTLCVEWDGAGEVFLSGPAEIVFTGDWPDSSSSEAQDKIQLT